MHWRKLGVVALGLALAGLAVGGCEKPSGRYLHADQPGGQQQGGSQRTGGVAAAAPGSAAYTAAGTLQSDYPHLAGLPLLRDIVPQDGRWVAPSPPGSVATAEDRAAEVAAFSLSADPLHDDALMRRLVEGGAPAYEALLKRAGQVQPAQLLALIALCQYTRPASADESGSWPRADKLFKVLEDHPRREYAAPLATWLGTGADIAVARRLACLLARCGGPVAKDALLRTYDAWTFVRRIPRQPPFFAVKPTALDSERQVWAIYYQGSGPHYAMFNYPGLASWRDLFLAVDNDADSKYEEILYTNICYALDNDTSSVPRKKVLSLDMSKGKLVVTHFDPLLRWYSETWRGGTYQSSLVDNARYITNQVDLEAVRADSDADSLPDLAERAMLLDPHNRDTDGDGVVDGEDPLPNLDQAQLGKLERGVQRAIICNQQRESSWPDRDYPLPWYVTYYMIEGAGNVAASPVSFGYGICIRDNKDVQAYEQQRHGSDFLNLTRVQVLDLRGVKPSKQRIDYGQYDAEYWVADPDRPANALYAVVLGFQSSGDCVYLAEKDGELFPVAVNSAWI